MHKKGFTLVELGVVAIIAGALILIAVPSMLKSINRNYALDAMRSLMMIHAAQQNYYSKNNLYYENSSDLKRLNLDLGIDIIKNPSSNYNCYSAGSGTAAIDNRPTCEVYSPHFDTMVVYLDLPINVQSLAVYCNTALLSDYNPCCLKLTATAGAACPG